MTETTLQEAKRAARAEALGRRAAAHADAARRFGTASAGEALRRRFLEAITVPDGAAVSAYWPVRSEIDTRPLLTALHEAGHACGLPVIVRRGAALIFRRWQPGMTLLARPFGLLEPGPEAEEVIPDIVLVPLLAFDSAGRRLGYGGGYYDCTLAGLRRAGREVVAIGVAYAAQGCDHVPADESDERLDWVVTEQGAIRFRARR
jgi:5-formyltetrahydrofolate cyclo-ligase